MVTIEYLDGSSCEFPSFRAAAQFLEGANLKGQDLSMRNLSFGHMVRAELEGANLSGANLRGVNATGARFAYADLPGADLRDAVCYGTNFYGANLTGASLWKTNLTGADLRKASVVDAVFYDAAVANNTLLPHNDVISLSGDTRGHVWFAVRNTKVGYYVKAGCRWFTPDEARQHWTSDEYLDEHGRSTAAESRARAEYLHAVAVARGWMTGIE